MVFSDVDFSNIKLVDKRTGKTLLNLDSLELDAKIKERISEGCVIGRYEGTPLVIGEEYIVYIDNSDEIFEGKLIEIGDGRKQKDLINVKYLKLLTKTGIIVKISDFTDLKLV